MWWRRQTTMRGMMPTLTHITHSLTSLTHINHNSERYNFALTESDGRKTVGFCRRYLPLGSSTRYPECLCIVSQRSCYALLSDILDYVYVRWVVQPGLFSFIHFTCTFTFIHIHIHSFTFIQLIRCCVSILGSHYQPTLTTSRFVIFTHSFN
jgi:hypothetical protein